MMIMKDRTVFILAASSSVILTIYLIKKRRNVTAQDAKSREETSKKPSCSSTVTDDDAPPIQEIRLDKENSHEASSFADKKRILTRDSISIVHGSMTGTCADMAKKLHQSLREQSSLPVQMGPAEEWDWWDELVNDDNINDSAKNPALLVLLLPTYTSGTWPPCARNLHEALQELQNDWRIAKFPLKNKLQVAIFGMGSSAYGDNTMGQPARAAVRSFQKLGAKCVVRLAIGDDSVGTHAAETFQTWSQDLLLQIKDKNSSCACGKATEDGCSHVTSNPQEDSDPYASEGEEEEDEPEVIDLEDMGDALRGSEENNADASSEPKEMVTPSQASALKKEGYRLIGTHSAVKLCRWTKHQLRGRGGCYKHTFYGITSYQCMEATPSLACANKCVFCWRHHKNPVGKEWRWKTDEPDFIVQQAVDEHVKMIKETKGIPGVQMDRWKEAHTVRHCALSLVGEPIMYPRINDLLGELHDRQISTFLVTNGQHPHAIDTLIPVTQLYVSVDAPTKESLVAIDRPLFNDAWDRLKQSLSSLKNKGQRTVARLTVVKGWNSDEIEGYADLIALGQVSLVEVKGVTFCGKSDASNLNMSNTPFHHEVVDLTKKLKEELDKLRAKGGPNAPPEYGLACEHKHSVSVLLARVDQFSQIDPVTEKRQWKTWIDYGKFHELFAKHKDDPSFSFSVEDYTAETPSWALFGANEEGFDPTEMRHRRKKKYPMYTKFDDLGVPTHDHNGEEISLAERAKLIQQMEERISEIGTGSTVTEFKDGAKQILDASLMFRGLTVVK